MVSPLAASSSSTVRDYNFDTPQDLTDNFDIKVGPNTNLNQISVSTENASRQSNWGINNTGGLRINVGNAVGDERAIILSTKERYT